VQEASAALTVKLDTDIIRAEGPVTPNADANRIPCETDGDVVHLTRKHPGGDLGLDARHFCRRAGIVFLVPVEASAVILARPDRCAILIRKDRLMAGRTDHNGDSFVWGEDKARFQWEQAPGSA